MGNNLVYIGELPNGMEVYDKSPEESHWKTAHKAVTPELLNEALSKIQTQDKLFIGAIDMGRIIGKTYCVPTTNLDEVLMARRYGRAGETPTVFNKPPVDCSKLVVILKKEDDKYVLQTTYIGELAPLEPWDPVLLNEGNLGKIKEAEDFWRTHALVYDKSAIDYFVINGENVSKEEVENKYISNRQKFEDFPDDALLIMIGVAGGGKSTKANMVAEYFNGEIISSDEIRNEIFSELNIENTELYSKDSKDEVYKVLIEKVEANLKKGKFTIADATFLLESGEKARKELYRLAKENGRPIRAIVMRVPYEIASYQNSQREKPVNDDVIKEMCAYMDENYSVILQELASMSNTRVAVVDRSNEKIPEIQDPRY